MREVNITSNLIDRLRRGEETALRQLYELSYPQCASFVKNNQGTPNDAEDMFQEALVVLYRKINDAGFELKSHIKTFLYAITRNLWLNELRKRSKSGLKLVMDDKETDYVLVDEDLLAEKEEEEEKHNLIGKMLMEIEGNCKELLINFYYKKMKLREIAEVMGFTEQYAKKRRYKCMEAFKKSVRERYGQMNDE